MPPRSPAPPLPRSPLIRLSLNSLWLLMARILSQGLLLIFTIAVARTLGAADLGRFAFISAVVFIGNVVTTFGLDTLLLREVAARRGNLAERATAALQETVTAALLLQLALAAIFISVVWIAGPRLPNQTAETAPALRLAALSLIPLAFSTVHSAILRAHERMDLYLIFSLVAALIIGAGGIVLWRRGGSLLGAVGVVVLSQSAGALVAAVLCCPYQPRLIAQPARLRRALRRVASAGATLATLMILSVLYQRSGLLLLSLLTDDAATGWYSAAARVLEALKLIPGAFFGAVFPMLAANAAVAQPVNLRRAYARGFTALVALSILLAALTTILAGPLVVTLYGPGYAPAADALRLMAWSLPLTVFTFKYSFELVVGGLERVAMLSMLLTLLLSAGLTVTLIGRWSLTGAAAALVASELVQVCILALLSARIVQPVRLQEGRK
ncbi:oligosaccharide flippase family protein [Promineifilum sp.]|uniref:oligosaccharide flippase family protein n=1 Tax=Promineifilum sp. TaxID=2664178 RepID=UPI0035B2890B